MDTNTTMVYTIDYYTM